MRLAVISDVHANLPALEAVLERLQRERFDRLVCLGDSIGYNAEPGACIDILRAVADVVVVGNHDRDALRAKATTGTHSVARRVQQWTAERLDASHRAWIESLPNIWVEPGVVVAVHGCYLNPQHVAGYVTPTMLGANLEALAANPQWPALALCGHTHISMLGWSASGVGREPLGADPVRWPPRADAVLVNPGAVGQPRDGDPRASCALVDCEAREVQLLRVPYDIDRAVAAIARAGLPEELGERLRTGS